MSKKKSKTRAKELAKPEAKREAKSTALVRVDEHPIDNVLDAAQRKLLAEALRRGEETRDAIEDALVSFGRWVLVNVFDNDAREALENARANPVWQAITARAGGPSLRLSPRMLSVALHVAGYDKRIHDDVWRGLDLGRKELLLPLGEEKLLREAAQHVTAFKLSQRATREYVGGVMAESGAPRVVRLTAPRLRGRVRKLREALEGRGFLKKVQQLAKAMDEPARKEITREVEALRQAADALLAQMRAPR